MARTRTCGDCGTPDGVQVHGLCTPCNVKRGEAERAAQGLGPKVTDPVAIERIRRVLARHVERSA